LFLFLSEFFLSKLDTDDGLVEPTNWSMGFPCDGWTAGRKKERRVSLSYTIQTSSETDPTVHSLIFGWAGVVVVGREGGGLSLVQSSKKQATKYGEIGNDRGWIFSLWVHLKLLCKHYGHISASREKEIL
jgi:hypothetical protein